MEIWKPDYRPPQVVPRASEKLMDALLAQGLTKVYSDAVPVFREAKPVLREYIKGVKVDDLDDYRPITVVRAASLITGLAYVESGYDQQVDEDDIIIGEMEAELEGVPTVFLSSYSNDPELQKLIDVLADTPEFQDGKDEYDYPKLLEIGAGCTRHFMQQAVAA